VWKFIYLFINSLMIMVKKLPNAIFITEMNILMLLSLFALVAMAFAGDAVPQSSNPALKKTPPPPTGGGSHKITHKKRHKHG
jgi:hypothetical protein